MVEAVRLGERVAVPWAEARLLLAELERAALAPAPLVRRLARAGAIAALTQARLEEGAGFADAFSAARAGREALVDEALAAPAVTDRLSRALLRTLVKSTEPGEGSGPARALAALAAPLTAPTVRPRPPR